MPAGCLSAPSEFVAGQAKICQALTDAVVHGLKWLQITQQPPEIRDRLKTAGDYALVIANAPIPEVTISIIADIAQRRFRFRFDGLGLIEAMERYGLIKGGDSSDDGYDLCRSWEYDCMRAWRMMPAEYAAIPLTERAAMVWSMQRSDIWQGLNSERDRMRRGR
jgi:hypothetical protein